MKNIDKYSSYSWSENENLSTQEIWILKIQS